MKKLFFSFAIAALLTSGCSKDDTQPPKAEIENLSGVTAVSQGKAVNLRAKVTSDLEYAISWSVNRQTVAEATGETFDFFSYQPDEYVITLTVVNRDGTDTDEITVTVNNDLYVIDFENPDVLDYLAGPTAAGENLYESSWSNPDGVPVIGAYQDATTGLYMTINESFGEINFWNGGIAISRWNDMITEGLPNQCSVYYKDAATGFGGYGGSQTFAVANADGQISFDDGITECTFDHFWVTNSTYTALSMMNGDMFAKQFSYDDKDWLKLIIAAFTKDDEPTGTTIELYLADFRTATSPGILTEWTMVNLTPLGNNVHTVKFDLQSSDVGDWGMNTPAYFCFDNLAVKK